MIKLPETISLASLPTRIEKLDRLSETLGGPDIYIKRDDQTGLEYSGNKVRKLEFVVRDALDQGCDLLITCGGIQSNHARATAAVAARLGISSYLVLRGEETAPDGNHFLDKLLGARIRFISPEDYQNRRQEIMEEVKDEMSKEGYKPYIIPEGASNGLGLFGYYKAMEEIINQEEEMGVKFDCIVTAVGSGGTYGGLYLANKIDGGDRKIYGVNVCDDGEYFKDRISKILIEGLNYIDAEPEIICDEIEMIDGYVGRGYALSRPEELNFIYEISRLEGIILDPVYTGKAFYGLTEEIKNDRFNEHSNILFIHTGGLYGLFPKRSSFEL